MRQTENVRRTEEVLTDIIVAVKIQVEIAHTIALIVALITTPLIAVIVIVTINVLRLLGGKSPKRRINPRCSIFYTRS